MAQQTTTDGVTVEEIDAAYKVLEVIRDNMSSEDMFDFAKIANEAHYLVQQYDEGANWQDRQTFDTPDVGDVVFDKESEYGSGDVRVTEVLNKPSKLHYIDVDTGKRSVAYLNPSHPPDAPVVKGQYVSGSDKTYAFPSTRLKGRDK